MQKLIFSKLKLQSKNTLIKKLTACDKIIGDCQDNIRCILAEMPPQRVTSVDGRIMMIEQMIGQLNGVYLSAEQRAKIKQCADTMEEMRKRK